MLISSLSTSKDFRSHIKNTIKQPKTNNLIVSLPIKNSDFGVFLQYFMYVQHKMVRMRV